MSLSSLLATVPQGLPHKTRQMFLGEWLSKKEKKIDEIMFKKYVHLKILRTTIKADEFFLTHLYEIHLDANYQDVLRDHLKLGIQYWT